MTRLFQKEMFVTCAPLFLISWLTGRSIISKMTNAVLQSRLMPLRSTRLRRLIRHQILFIANSKPRIHCPWSKKLYLLYQQLISFHLNDATPGALIDVDIERIEFVNEKGVQENKKELYLLALNHIARQYENLPAGQAGIPAASQAWYLIAAQHNEDANTYQPYGDTTHRYDRVKAKEICEKILAQKDSSEGKINCYNLLNEINRKDLQFSVEKVNIPGQPFRSFIQYKNFHQLYLRLIKADESLKNETSNYYDDKFWSRLTNAAPIRSWTQDLPVVNDLQKHSVEIKIDALPAGEYFLLGKH
jgi:hypothetical protein